MQTISKFFRDWLNMLMGKPRSSLPSLSSSISGSKENKKTDVFDAENPIASDIAKAKEVSKKLISSIEKKLKPSLVTEKKVISDSNNFVSNLVAKVKIISESDLTKKIGIVFFVFVLVVFAVIAFSRFIVKGPEQKTPANFISFRNSPTPVQTEFRPIQLSIYSNDKAILELEERINILSRQIDSVNIRENTLTPPDLDFSINF